MRHEGVKLNWIIFVGSIAANAYAAILKLQNQIVGQAEIFGRSVNESI